MNRMENFCKIYEKQTFELFLLGPIQVKMDPKNKAPGGPYSRRLWKQFQCAYKTVETFVKIRWKTDF